MILYNTIYQWRITQTMSLVPKLLLILVPWKEAPANRALEYVNARDLLSVLTGYSLLIYSCFTLNKISSLLLQSMWDIISALRLRGPESGNSSVTSSSINSLVGLGGICLWSVTSALSGVSRHVYIAPRKSYPTHTNLKVRPGGGGCTTVFKPLPKRPAGREDYTFTMREERRHANFDFGIYPAFQLSQRTMYKVACS